MRCFGSCWGKSAQSVARSEEQWRHQYAHLALRRNPAIAKVAMERKLAVRMFGMLRQGWDWQQIKRFGDQLHTIGVARLTQWCEVDHRTFDWRPAPFKEGV